MARSAQLNRLLRKMKATATTPREKVLPALIQSAHELAEMQKRFAPVDTGNLRESIQVTLPSQTTPPYSQPGGSRTAKPTEALVTAGDTLTRYPHLVEHGALHAPAQSFFFPAYRLLRKRLLARIARTAKRAIREEWSK